MSTRRKKISFPADSVINAVIQDGDVTELHKILHLKRGEVNINRSNHVGLTALHQAVLGNNLDAVKILLCNGSDVNARDVHGYTPLHIAAACNFLPVASLLLVFGADVFSTTTHSDLPVDVTADIRMIRLLRGEMYRKVHDQLFLRTLIKSKLSHIWYKIRKFLMLILNMIIVIFVSLWRITTDLLRTPARNSKLVGTSYPPTNSASLNNNQIKGKEPSSKIE